MVVQRTGDGSSFSPYDILIVGGGIAGSASPSAYSSGTPNPSTGVRGEFMAPWGVIELGKLGLLDLLKQSGGTFSRRNVPYDENMPGAQALPYMLRFSDVLPEIEGAFCMSHPAMLRHCVAAERQGTAEAHRQAAVDCAGPLRGCKRLY